MNARKLTELVGLLTGPGADRDVGAILRAFLGAWDIESVRIQFDASEQAVHLWARRGGGPIYGAWTFADVEAMVNGPGEPPGKPPGKLCRGTSEGPPG